MKKLYDSSVKPQSYEIGEKVLVYDPKKPRGRFAKWDVRWVGPFVIENKLNSANYVIKKGRGKPVVIHVDRLHKLPAEIDTGDSSSPASDIPATSPPAKRCKSDTAAAATSARRPSPQSTAGLPLTRLTDRCCSRDNNATSDSNSTDTGDEYQPVTVDHGSDTASAAVTATAGSPRLAQASPCPPCTCYAPAAASRAILGYGPGA